MFWQPEYEKMSRKNLEKLQLSRLKKTVRLAYDRVPFYRDKFRKNGIKPQDIQKPEDIGKIPFTGMDDLRANYPFGMLAAEKHKIVRLHTSSGTTGKPKAIFFTRNDLETSANLIARCILMTGASKNDVFQNMMSYGLFTGGLVMHYGAEKVGMLIIPAGIGNTERQILLMQDFGTTTVHITPSYALYLADVLEKKGIDPKKGLSLKRAYIGAEPHSEETRKKIETIFNIDAFNSYGLSEMNGPGVAFECTEKNGMHLWEDNFMMEILDPGTDKPVGDGKEGELVLTTLCREGMPVLRYRTRDITSILPEKCRCGRTHRRISRFAGRVDDMIVVRGVNIYPQQVERTLMGVKGVGRNYQIELQSYDEMTVKVEIAKEIFDGSIEHLSALKQEIGDKLKTEILVRPRVELHEPGTLPVSEGKAKRVIDNRKL